MIPDRMKLAIDAYVNDRRPVGGFLTAVLSNNLKESFAMADEDNRAHLYDIVRYCHNEIPFVCWGSPQKVKAWLQREDLSAGDMPEDREFYYNERAERMP